MVYDACEDMACWLHVWRVIDKWHCSLFLQVTCKQLEPVGPQGGCTDTKVVFPVLCDRRPDLNLSTVSERVAVTVLVKHTCFNSLYSESVNLKGVSVSWDIFYVSWDLFMGQSVNAWNMLTCWHLLLYWCPRSLCVCVCVSCTSFVCVCVSPSSVNLLLPQAFSSAVCTCRHLVPLKLGSQIICKESLKMLNLTPVYICHHFCFIYLLY